MGRKAFKTNKSQNLCPKCGNAHSFVGVSEQVAEDSCEIWVECICGFNPFEGNSGHCIESVWGTLDNDYLLMALDSWNELTKNQSKEHCS
ncbi:hypothetical protein D6U78_09965 [Vibrio cholerae]|nr:hypothetical protein [Vibrio cholerae]